MLVALILAAALSMPQEAPTAGPSSSEAQTSTAGTPGSATQTPPQDPGERVVCRREHQVGSNRPIRTCRKQKEWDQLRDESLRSYNRAQRGNAENIDPSRAN